MSPERKTAIPDTRFCGHTSEAIGHSTVFLAALEKGRLRAQDLRPVCLQGYRDREGASSAGVLWLLSTVVRCKENSSGPSYSAGRVDLREGSPTGPSVVILPLLLSGVLGAPILWFATWTSKSRIWAWEAPIFGNHVVDSSMYCVVPFGCSGPVLMIHLSFGSPARCGPALVLANGAGGRRLIALAMLGPAGRADEVRHDPGWLRSG